jgi:hypothetical protein
LGLGIFQITAEGKGKVYPPSDAGTVADIVEEKAHGDYLDSMSKGTGTPSGTTGMSSPL